MSHSMEESHLVLLRLKPIKDALQRDTWNARKDKILATTNRVISESIADEDAYTIHGEETCMIALAKTTLARAEAIASDISDRIVRGLFGDFGATTFPLEPTILAIRDLLKDVNSGDSHNLLQDILNNHGDGFPTETEGYGHRIEIRNDSQKASRRRKLHEMYEPEGPAKVTHEYRSVWQVDDQIVNCFRYVPCLQKTATERVIGYEGLGDNYSKNDLIELDFESTENAMIDLKRAVDVGHDIKLSLPIHFETIGSSHSRSEIKKVLSILPPSFRQRISFTMNGIPDGIPEGRLREVVINLKPFSRSISVMLNSIPTNAASFRNMLAKIRTVGVDTICVRLPRDASQKDLTDLNAIVPQISSVGLRTGAFGLTSGDEVIQLVASGCPILGGYVFGGPFEDLPPPYSMPLRRFRQAGSRSVLPNVFFA